MLFLFINHIHENFIICNDLSVIGMFSFSIDLQYLSNSSTIILQIKLFKWLNIILCEVKSWQSKKTILLNICLQYFNNLFLLSFTF